MGTESVPNVILNKNIQLEIEINHASERVKGRSGCHCLCTRYNNSLPQGRSQENIRVIVGGGGHLPWGTGGYLAMELEEFTESC